MKTVWDTIFLFFKVLAEPFVLCVLIMIITVIFNKKKKKRAVTISSIVLVLVIVGIGNGFLGKITANYLQKEYKNRTNSNPDIPAVIVVLGGGITDFNGIESPHITSYSRLVATTRLYNEVRKRQQSCTILVSGKGNSTITSEAVLFRKALMAMGIPDSDIIEEDRSENTYQNAKYSSAILQKQKPSHVYLVTSGFHLKRALLLFETFGITGVPYPSDYINTRLTVFPNSYNFAFTSFMLKEIVGIAQVHFYNSLGLNKSEKQVR
ncbi:YdcF family protein [Flavobacterium cerinum]|uniref:YdcF family protein n=1 Tax=Flavobacterium cerinum TaxID=2502784 RepID=A0ABY5IQU8_9FLAO|nr:YdcF family protein [Flavobacterium cerinum]UUC43806.1 YdcF family protein [Flavobacterium cerinum]